MYQRHPLSAAFPTMSAEEQDALTSDIEHHGQRDPITIYDGQVLDGWHRYCACQKLKIEPNILSLYPGIDPVAFVISHNMHRRHLDGSQRAAAAIKCSAWSKAGDNQYTKTGMEPSSRPKTNAELAKVADVSTKTIQQAKTAEIAGLGDKVRDGELSAKKAAEMAKPKPATPPPSTTPEPEPEEPKPETVTIEKEQYEETKSDAERWQSISVMLHGDQQLIDAAEEIASLSRQLDAANSRRDAIMAEKNEAIKQVKYWKKQYEKLKTEIEKYVITEVGL